MRVLSARLQVFDVVETGELMELTVQGELKTELNTERVLIIVDDDDKKIWLWKGTEAGVRKKFIAARQGQAVRSQRGLVYKVMSIDGGEEPDAFLALLGEKPKPAEPKKEVAVQVELPDKTIEISPDAPPPEHTPKPVKVKSVEAPKPMPAAMPVASTQLGTEYNGAEQQWPQRPTMMSSVPAPAQDDIVGRVADTRPPPGYIRELVIIGQEVFTSVDRTVTFLGKTQTTSQLERTRTLPDGPFFGGEYTPRILVESGRVLATEFLKKSDENSHGLRDAVAEADVSELIDIFRITTETADIGSDDKAESKKGKKKSKKSKSK
ncbi:MAG: hypothetical protein ACFFDU_06075 [Candidatus Thorarchaeota archaeon]